MNPSTHPAVPPKPELVQSVGIFEAKTRLSQLVEQVATTGEPITVTKRGRPVAQIVPPPAEVPYRMTREQALMRIRELRAAMPPYDADDIRSAIEEGRR